MEKKEQNIFHKQINQKNEINKKVSKKLNFLKNKIEK
jgi:hypothetical protein